MRLICPSCGAMHSAEAWEADLAARETLKVVAQMPDPARFQVLAYLACFRPATKALNWKKALGVMAELSELVKEKAVTWEHSSLPVTVKMWADGMEAVSGKPDLTRPLKNHNLLRSIVSSIAKGAAAKKENEEEERRRYPLKDRTGAAESREGKPMSAEEWKQRQGLASLVQGIGKQI